MTRHVTRGSCVCGFPAFRRGQTIKIRSKRVCEINEIQYCTLRSAPLRVRRPRAGGGAARARARALAESRAPRARRLRL